MWRIRIWSRNNERVTARRRCMIKDGYMKKGANVRVMQGDAIMYDGKLKVGVGCAGFGGGVAVVSSLEVICSTVVVVPSGRTRDNPHTAVAVSRRARRRERDDDDDDDRSRAAHTSGVSGVATAKRERAVQLLCPRVVLTRRGRALHLVRFRV